VSHISDIDDLRGDDLVGFLREYPSSEGCGTDIVNVAYGLDNDGDPAGEEWDYRSPRAAVGIAILGMPSDSLDVNYNWYTSVRTSDTMLIPIGNWGSRRKGTIDDPFRHIGSGLGYPEGDENKYYLMSHKEFDYDQLFCALNHTWQFGRVAPRLYG